MNRYVLVLLTILVITVCSEEVWAFWGSDTKNPASGLDVATGFDVNTITTVTGKVMTLPERTDPEQHAVMTIAALKGEMKVILGPWWYWEKQSVTITKNQDITVTGSLAQGKDGVLYLFAQRLENRTTGETVILRSETGKPLWSRGGTGNGNRQNDRNGSRSGAGSRGGGARGGRR